MTLTEAPLVNRFEVQVRYTGSDKWTIAAYADRIHWSYAEAFVGSDLVNAVRIVDTGNGNNVVFYKQACLTCGSWEECKCP